MTTPVRYYYRAKPRSLSMIINGALSSCCADSGSEVNCMTDTYARAIGAVVTNEIVLFHLPVRGRFLRSVGFAQLICRFPTLPSMDQQVEFFVFKKLQCQVLFGRQFLRSTHTLDLYQHRLRVADSFPSAPLAVRSVGQVEERVHCWLDGEPVSSLADTGSDFNLISLNLAHSLGSRTKSEGKIINYGDEIAIEFADCSTVMTDGSIQLTVSFCAPETSSSAVYKLVAPSRGGGSTHGEELVHQRSKIIDTFYIVEHLDYDAILGETLLATVDIYNRHQARFHASVVTERSCISIARKKRAKEGKTSLRLPLTQQQKFMDDFDLEYDRHSIEKDDIEKEMRQGLISEEQAKIKIYHADQYHLQWLHSNREHLDEYYPGYYEKHVPQEIA
ncbi:hypothetical protein N431DRAFT_334812 [Stipitochalara longipes BDJ]|nr:hypothetical protein N431DRAFT_334812 [Stipitochalara longipes BDJ]